MDEQNKSAIFRQWVEQYYSFGFRLARHILLNDEESRDIVQDAFVKVWENMQQYRDGSRFTTWFYRIVVNLCYDRLRKEKNQQKYREEFMLNETEMTQDALSLQAGREAGEWVNRLVHNLGDKQRIVFILRDMEDMQMQEISEVTGMTPEQVKANLYHARKAMRSMLVKLNIWEERK